MPIGTRTPGDGALRCVARVDVPAGSGGGSRPNVVVHARMDDTAIRALVFNGHWISGNGNIYHGFDFTVTPWVKPGAHNEVIIVTGRTALREASVDFYDPAQDP